MGHAPRGLRRLGRYTCPMYLGSMKSIIMQINFVIHTPSVPLSKELVDLLTLFHSELKLIKFRSMNYYLHTTELSSWAQQKWKSSQIVSFQHLVTESHWTWYSSWTHETNLNFSCTINRIDILKGPQPKKISIKLGCMFSLTPIIWDWTTYNLAE
jgi:hypothetical protein